MFITVKELHACSEADLYFNIFPSTIFQYLHAIFAFENKKLKELLECHPLAFFQITLGNILSKLP